MQFLVNHSGAILSQFQYFLSKNKTRRNVIFYAKHAQAERRRTSRVNVQFIVITY